MRKIRFTKMVATGNDFVVIDNRSPHIAYRISHIAKKLCDRKNGVGADGLLLLEKSSRARLDEPAARQADFKMRIFNPDGSEAEMCGNGSRCIALYAKINKIAQANMSIETAAGILHAKAGGKSVKINMTEPKAIELGINIKIGERNHRLHHINTGVPHAVCFVDKIDRADVFNVGKKIRNNAVFKPNGTNVDFIQARDKRSIFMRTYERGVEAETLACGTGAVASAIISSILKGYASPVKVYTRGGVLTIYFDKKSNSEFSNVFLEGEAREVFTGKISV